MDQDPRSTMNLGTAHVKSNDLWSVTQLIKLHYCIYSGYKLRTYLLGYAYQNPGDDEDLTLEESE